MSARLSWNQQKARGHRGREKIRGVVPLPLGEGGATASGLARRAEGRAEREPDRAKPKEKSSQILRPSPYPLPEGEGESSAIAILHSPMAVVSNTVSGSPGSGKAAKILIRK